MPVKVLVPRLGEGVEEITITKWLKQEGDQVNELEPLLEVNTDKVDTEIPSPASGTLSKIEVREGQTVQVGELLALIQTIGDQTSEPTQTDQLIERPPSTVHNPSTFISPVVAKIAAEYGLDLRQVKGTGLGGRITKDDVLAVAHAGEPVNQKISKSAGQETGKSVPKPAGPSNKILPSTNLPSTNLPTTDSLLPHTPIRKQIAEHMLASKRSAPHVLTVMEADMGRVVADLAANKQAFGAQGVNLTYTAYFIAALAAGLKTHPLVNSSWRDEGTLLHAAIHIGLAVSLGEEGLIVPVIRDADRLSLLEVARSVNDLAARARAKKLHADEVKGGTFTLTNHGVSGSLLAMPVINQPQCGILGVGALQKRVVVVTDPNGSDAIAIRPMVYLSFVFDHRILDGTAADRFLAKVKEILEKWGQPAP